MKVSRLDRPCLVEKWVHLGGVLTGEEGDAFVAVGDLRGTTPPQRRRTSLGKELGKHLARLVSISVWLYRFLYLVLFTCCFLVAYILLHHIGSYLLSSCSLCIIPLHLLKP